MKYNLYTIGQYTDTKRYYVSRLVSVGEFGEVTRRIMHDDIHTKYEALAIKRSLDEFAKYKYKSKE